MKKTGEILIEINGPTDIFKFFPKKELEEIESLLNEQSSDQVAGLQRQIALLAGWQGRCASLLADAESLLCFSENAVLMERTEGETDLTRKTRMRNATRNERRLRDILLGFSKAIRGKLIALQSLKKSYLSEIIEGHEG